MSANDGRPQSPGPRDIESLVELFDASEWDELHLRIDDVEVFLSKDPHARAPGTFAGATAVPVPPGRAASLTSPARVPLPAPQGPAAEPPVAAHWVAVKAPNLGTFYRAPKPGAAPFVELGQPVRPDTELCLIEVMKLFTTVPAGIAGVVRKICIRDADMVESGDVLFYIEPA